MSYLNTHSDQKQCRPKTWPVSLTTVDMCADSNFQTHLVGSLNSNSYSLTRHCWPMCPVMFLVSLAYTVIHTLRFYSFCAVRPHGYDGRASNVCIVDKISASPWLCRFIHVYIIYVQEQYCWSLSRVYWSTYGLLWMLLFSHQSTCVGWIEVDSITSKQDLCL